MGQSHWRAKGRRYDHSDCQSRVPLRTPEAMTCPMTQQLRERRQPRYSEREREGDAQVDVGSKVRTKSDGRDLGGVGASESLEDSPAGSHEDLTGEEDVKVGSKDGEEDPGNQERQGCSRH
jgi:hypothetical protein